MEIVFRGLEVNALTASTIADLASSAETEARALLPTLPATIRMTVQAGTHVIPEEGSVGRSLRRGSISWTVDPDRAAVIDTAKRWLRYSVLHELNHQARGAYSDITIGVVLRMIARGFAPDYRIIGLAINEGLATAFERDVGGHHPARSVYPAEPEVRRWVQELLSLRPPLNYGTWMFHHPDGRRLIGYRAGTFIVDRAMAATGLSAAELTTVRAREILRLAGF